MKTYKEVTTILANMRDKDFDKLCYYYCQWAFSNGSKRNVRYWLKKVGLTLREYEMWVGS